MFNGDRDQYIRVTHGPNEVGPATFDIRLQRLDDVWKYYRESGSGKALSEDKAQVVYMLAKYLTVTRGSGMGEDEAVAKVGLSYDDCWSKLKRLNLTGYQEAGLWTRADFLIDVAQGIKPIPRKAGISNFQRAGLDKRVGYLVDVVKGIRIRKRSVDRRLRLAEESDIKPETEGATPGNLKKLLGRLQNEWDHYINQTSGKKLSLKYREIVYKLAEWQVRRISGLSNPDQLPTLPEDITRSARIGLITRARHLARIATGKKPGYWEVRRQKAVSLPEGRLMPEFAQSIEQDPRYIERDFEDQRIDSKIV